MVQVRVPDLGEGIDTVRLVAWLAGEGQAVSAGDDLAELVTDKAVFNVASPAAGMVVKRFFLTGDEIAVGAVIAEIG